MTINENGMNTVVIQIGNSDDKLTQMEWARFVFSVGDAIQHLAHETHFSGFSLPNAPWQNAAWVFEIDFKNSLILLDNMRRLAEAFKQDSIAWTQGETIFVGSKPETTYPQRSE